MAVMDEVTPSVQVTSLLPTRTDRFLALAASLVSSVAKKVFEAPELMSTSVKADSVMVVSWKLALPTPNEVVAKAVPLATSL